MRPHLFFTMLLMLQLFGISALAHPSSGWDARTIMAVDGGRITLSTPALVRRSRRYCWLPQLHRVQKTGHLVLTMGAHADMHVPAQVKYAMVSRDTGLTWDEPRVVVGGGSASLSAPGGELVLLPMCLRPFDDGTIGAPVTLIGYRGDTPILHYRPDGVVVSGLPRLPQVNRQLDVADFHFNGQVVPLPGWGHLATMYGVFDGDERSSLIAVDSRDRSRWMFRSIIASADGDLPGMDGPCESAMCRLPDGRIMCVFRVQSNDKAELPLAQTFSSDDGNTWTRPVQLNGPGSVEPSLAVLGSGVVALSSGRPGVGLWINTDGTYEKWQKIDIADHHNACHPTDPITKRSLVTAGWAGIQTTGYTEVVAIDDHTLLMVYDRLARGWDVISDGRDESNSVWAVCIRVEP